ncbi:N-acetyl-anhydromuramyl-L-alanine amidase AmpD [Balneicella halophila]|uniref:N-acetylmuramoyl-L-alanine amidase n=1 Tax=Balneicella halophila TaxID=1537566 RepID=A0A7L4UPV3_BALHA|nr:N-acetylmuramoyl-L-alanine amidase [Balneicella halophila]PVX50073.1 N-acetyl-anhydromuramyl-L-alanine amidase AmpD [Balneicella halophila]
MKNSWKYLSLLLIILFASCATREYIPRIDGLKIDAKTHEAIGQDKRIKILVMHYTVADYPSSIQILTKKQVSAHYLVGDDALENKVYQLVREDKRAWHAGVSYWQGRTNLNDSSIGIEIVNKGFIEKDGERIFFPFDGNQMQKVAKLAQSIVERYKIPPTAVVAHADIAPGRKQDPGPLFPWEILHKKYNVGAWYDIPTVLEFLPEFYKADYDSVEFIEKVQNDFHRYGYKIEQTGEWDEQTKDVILTFQYHFRQKKCDGILDAETYAILQALNKKYNR